MSIILKDYQVEAINRIRNGNILCGGVGSGKSLTSLGYYYLINGGKLTPKEYIEVDGSRHLGAVMDSILKSPKNLVIITTAYKRDTGDWSRELHAIHMSPYPGGNYYDNKVIIDSWNNIGKYIATKDAFFIFDEQRVVGSGAWVKSFYKICKDNNWILLSATPGDKWTDYIPVFVANGFYRNKSEFTDEHIVYNYRVSFPQIAKYLGEKKLERLRHQILIDMDFQRQTVAHHNMIIVDYDRILYKQVCKERRSPYKTIVVKGHTYGKPIDNASEFCSILRRIVNSDISRQKMVENIIHDNNLDRVIIFYNFDFELEILKGLNYGEGYTVAEWNGHNHDQLPDGEKWIYLVQYNAGSEGWNCITTNNMIFYSENYSYRMMEQASGRIDRANTPYTDLYYWHLRSTSNIDLAINHALKQKKKFNAAAFVRRTDAKLSAAA